MSSTTLTILSRKQSLTMDKLGNGESLPKQEAPTPPTVGTRKKSSKQARTTGAIVDEDKKAPSASAERRDMTLEDPEALDCGICFLPLKPPIFQCDVGHVVCSPCRNKLKSPNKCHVCGGATGGFRRCHAMERLVESIHISCPNSASGYTARLAYHEQQRHQQTCMVRSRFRCPGESCSFAGSMETLLDHFAGVHHWPCTTNIRESKYESCNINLRNGFNFLRTNLPSTTATTSAQFLFLLNLVRQPDGAAISVLCIQSHTAAVGDGQGSSLKEVNCKIVYSQHRLGSSRPCNCDLVNYYLSSTFRVACTDFSEGLPNFDSRFNFVVPNVALENASTGNVEIDFRLDMD